MRRYLIACIVCWFVCVLWVGISSCGNDVAVELLPQQSCEADLDCPGNMVCENGGCVAAVDGDREIQAEAESDAEVAGDSEADTTDLEPQPACEDGEFICRGTQVFRCKEGVWKLKQECKAMDRICREGQCVCESHVSSKCYDGSVYWYDSCGNVEDIKEECSSELGEGICVEAACEEVVLDWVYVPGGHFQMGCSPGDLLCSSSQRPVHTVQVPDFKLLRAEVTIFQYLIVTPEARQWFTEYDDALPVAVTWHQARIFCEAVGARLPNEAEWEYAARAGTTTIYGCGDDSSCLESIAWYNANSEREVQPVMQLSPNAFGFYDMFGNLPEWVADCFHNSYSGAPDTAVVWFDDDCDCMLSRGGGGMDTYYAMRSSHREQVCSGDWKYAGFRCVRDVEQPILHP